ncbi:uncharacterized protein isoform X1 [Rhodnius prolixus]|uniref:uncharacterized protein isoform X1 n=1 Tax=Rhodnius prolixus TaxID=13249 RepID=UPI003D188005
MKRYAMLWGKCLGLFIAYLGLTNGAGLQTTYHFIHTGGGPLQNPLSTHNPVTDNKSSTSQTMKLINPNYIDKRNHPGNDDIPRDFIREIAGIKIPIGNIRKQLAIQEKIDEEDEDDYYLPGGSVKEDDYNGYSGSSGSEEDVQNNLPSYNYQAAGKIHRYKVKEKIPDDTKYVPPKMKIVAIPAPCLRTPPKPRPNTPKPPSIKGFPVKTYVYNDVKYRSRDRQSTPKKLITYPLLIRKTYTSDHAPRRKVIIRHQRLSPPPPPPKLLKEVHIHHHHKPTPIPVEMHLHESQDDNVEITPLQRKRLEMVIQQLKSNKDYSVL